MRHVAVPEDRKYLDFWNPVIKILPLTRALRLEMKNRSQPHACTAARPIVGIQRRECNKDLVAKYLGKA